MTDKPTPTDAVALARYKVVPAHESMFHRFAVVAGDGKQQLYLGREVECENMARKFAGAFLDGAFYQANITPSTQAADSVPAVEREQERIAFKDAHRHLELDEVPDAWGRPMFKHSHIEASWLGWIARASHGQAPASVLHLVHSAFAEIAMAFPKAFALHKVGTADTAVRGALAAPATAQADSVQEDACHAPPLGWRCTRKAGHEGPCAAVEHEDDQQFVERGMQRIRDAEDAARYQWLRRWKGQEHEPPFTVQHEIDGTLWGGDLDAAIDAAMNK